MGARNTNATRAALARLSADGCDMGKPLEMDFFVAVPDEESGHAVAKLAAGLGFETSVERDEKTSWWASRKWTCYCTKAIVPSFETVNGIERQLDDLARPLGGHCDGFGSFGNHQQAGPRGS